ncbi:MAG: M15 family metallopeptidase [Beijerinckiaceae bacterium]|jgi:hypothetical protein|nr:M15 family metallopeptidase [Beijerinckiaceae bacterium]
MSGKKPQSPVSTPIALLAILIASAQSVFPATANDRGTAKPIPAAIWQAMQGTSWHPGLGCPARENLALLSVPYRDFTGHRQTGQLIVARAAANGVLNAFAAIYQSSFRIQSMTLIHKFGGDDGKSMAANNTSGFNCRKTAGGTRLSEHSSGRAIDINPVQNPYVTQRGTLPPAGEAFDRPQERTRRHSGLIVKGGPVTRAFARIGWKWGGSWQVFKDYQHFYKARR